MIETLDQKIIDSLRAYRDRLTRYLYTREISTVVDCIDVINEFNKQIIKNEVNRGKG